MAGKTTTKIKGTTVEVILSVYWYKDKPISVIGIKNSKTQVGHDISKDALPGDAWFGVASRVKKSSRMLEDTRTSLINCILSDDSEVKFPITEAEDLPDYAELKHEIIKKDIEV